MMIVCRTFSRKSGLTRGQIQQAQEDVRAQAQAFINSELRPEEVVSLSESAAFIPIGMIWTLVSVTVWYRRER